MEDILASGKKKQYFQPMKRTLAFCLSVFAFVAIVSGQKNDYLWLLGRPYDTTNALHSSCRIDFDSTVPSIYTEYQPLPMLGASASIADKLGTLQFFTDGFSVYNRANQQMPNGFGLNPGPVADDYMGQGLSYPCIHGSMLIPKPEEDSVYYMFHTALRYGSIFGAFCNRFYFSTIDIRLNNGLGNVVHKNHVLVEDSLVAGGMAACKHANGKDWWLIVQESGSNCFFEFLLTAKGVDSIGKQCVDDTIHFPGDVGANCFSPDGSKYIRSNPFEHLSILDFDRCTGELSNAVRIAAIDSYTVATGNQLYDGIAVSPNSHYLYLATGTELRQYDLFANPISQSEIIIDNTLKGTPQTTTLWCQLAPDGKIYISLNAEDTLLHVINNPDLPGFACNFVRNGIHLPTYNSYYLPCYPNFRLGPLTGSGCDTIITSQNLNPENQQARIQPNPANKYVYVEMPMQGNYIFELLNETGQLIEQKETRQVDIFNTENLPSGIYYLKVVTGSGAPVTGAQKIVVQH